MAGLFLVHFLSPKYLLTDDKSTLVQVMAWCLQATSHCLKQCWPRSMSPYGGTRPWWVKGGKPLPQQNITFHILEETVKNLRWKGNCQCPPWPFSVNQLSFVWFNNVWTETCNIVHVQSILSLLMTWNCKEPADMRLLLMTKISKSSIKFWAWISNYDHIKQ